MLSENTILKFESGVEETSYERILFYDQTEDLAVTINIYDKTALPVFRQISNLETLLVNNCASIVTEEPFLRFLDPTNGLKAT